MIKNTSNGESNKSCIKNFNIILALTYYETKGRFTGGTQTLVRLLAGELSKRGHNINILTINHERTAHSRGLSEDNINERVKLLALNAYDISRLGLLGRHLLKHFNSRFYFRVNRVNKELTECDVIIYFDVNELSFPFCFLLNKKPKILYCCTLIEREQFYAKNYLPRVIFKICADYYLASNNETENSLKRLNFSGKKIISLPYGIDTERFIPSRIINDDMNVIGFLGGIEERKGLHILLKACRAVKSKFTLLIAGQPREEQYFDAIMKEIDFLNKTGIARVEYKGRIADAELVEFYNKLNVFVCPSLMEEFGLVLLEAMACEIPVIASSAGGMKTIIEDRVDGLLTEPGNSEELSQKIEILLNDKKMAEDIGRKGRVKVLKEYSITRTADGIESLIREKINGKGVK